jgi:hypothetical protein
MVRIDVTSNVTLTHTTWSHGSMRPAHKAHPIEYALVDSTSACVWTWMIPSGGADLLSHPGARGGLDARLGASFDAREEVSSPNHRE